MNQHEIIEYTRLKDGIIFTHKSRGASLATLEVRGVDLHSIIWLSISLKAVATTGWDFYTNSQGYHAYPSFVVAKSIMLLIRELCDTFQKALKNTLLENGVLVNYIEDLGYLPN